METWHRRRMLASFAAAAALAPLAQMRRGRARLRRTGACSWSVARDGAEDAEAHILSSPALLETRTGPWRQAFDDIETNDRSFASEPDSWGVLEISPDVAGAPLARVVRDRRMREFILPPTDETPARPRSFALGSVLLYGGESIWRHYNLRRQDDLVARLFGALPPGAPPLAIIANGEYGALECALRDGPQPCLEPAGARCAEMEARELWMAPPRPYHLLRLWPLSPGSA